MTSPATLSHGPLMIDIAGLELTELDRKRLTHPLVGGLILFSRNYVDRTQLMALCESIREIGGEHLEDDVVGCATAEASCLVEQQCGQRRAYARQAIVARPRLAACDRDVRIDQSVQFARLGQITAALGLFEFGFDLLDLAGQVAQYLRVNPDSPVVVQGDAKVQYDAVVQLMAALKEAGAPSVGLMTEPVGNKK